MEPESCPTSCASEIKACDHRTCPNLFCLVKDCLHSACEYEHSCSVLRRLSNYMHATLGQERLSSLTLLHMHYDNDIDATKAVDRCAALHPRCLEMNNMIYSWPVSKLITVLKLFVMLSCMSFKVIINWDIQFPKFFPRWWAPLALEPPSQNPGYTYVQQYTCASLAFQLHLSMLRHTKQPESTPYLLVRASGRATVQCGQTCWSNYINCLPRPCMLSKMSPKLLSEMLLTTQTNC